jgi:hypothetical protein
MKDKNSLSIRLDPAALLSSGLNTQTDSLLLDEETIRVLKTVCAAGGAHTGFNEDSNARLEQLVAAGLLAIATLPNTNPIARTRQRFCRPTKSGVATVEKLKERDGA